MKPKFIVPLLILTASFNLYADCSSYQNVGFSASGYSAYAAWCSACGGTPSNANGMSCTPGPNWGKGSGSIPSGSGGGGSNIALPMMMQSMFQAMLMQEEAQQREREELAARSRAIRDEVDMREQAELEDKKVRLLNEMKDVQDSGALQLKTGDPEDKSGQRVVDCKSTREAYERLTKGMPSQKDILERTRRQIESAIKAGEEDYKAMKKVLLEGLKKEIISFGRDYVKSRDFLSKRMDEMRKAGATPEQIKSWLKKMKLAEEKGKQLETVLKANFALDKMAQDKTKLETWNEALWKANEFMVESGLWKKAGESLAKAGFGPAGALTFRMSALTLDTACVVAGAKLNEDELINARKLYEQLERQYRHIEERVNTYARDLEEYCPLEKR